MHLTKTIKNALIELIILSKTLKKINGNTIIMKNRNLLIGAGVLIVGYYFYNKQLQTKPYTDAELDKSCF